MQYRVKIMNSKGKCRKTVYALDIVHAWALRRKLTGSRERGKIERLA